MIIIDTTKKPESICYEKLVSKLSNLDPKWIIEIENGIDEEIYGEIEDVVVIDHLLIVLDSQLTI